MSQLLSLILTKSGNSTYAEKTEKKFVTPTTRNIKAQNSDSFSSALYLAKQRPWKKPKCKINNRSCISVMRVAKHVNTCKPIRGLHKKESKCKGSFYFNTPPFTCKFKVFFKTRRSVSFLLKNRIYLQSNTGRETANVANFEHCVTTCCNFNYYMALSLKDWELPNSRIWLAEINIHHGLDFPILTGI